MCVYVYIHIHYMYYVIYDPRRYIHTLKKEFEAPDSR